MDEQTLDVNFRVDGFEFEQIEDRKDLQWHRLWKDLSSPLPPSILRTIWSLADFQKYKEFARFVRQQSEN